jgi:hypothetical protein
VVPAGWQAASPTLEEQTSKDGRIADGDHFGVGCGLVHPGQHGDVLAAGRGHRRPDRRLASGARSYRLLKADKKEAVRSGKEAFCLANAALANPEKRLKETNLDSDSALRKIVLGGEPGKRAVTVPAQDLVNAN